MTTEQNQAETKHPLKQEADRILDEYFEVIEGISDIMEGNNKPEEIRKQARTIYMETYKAGMRLMAESLRKKKDLGEEDQFKEDVEVMRKIYDVAVEARKRAEALLG